MKYQFKWNQILLPLENFPWSPDLYLHTYNNIREHKSHTHKSQYQKLNENKTFFILVQDKKQHLITIKNIPIYFPYQPYKGQQQYMEQVITQLQKSQNALIQSPTGTGKTLCFLCASLACARTHSQLKQVLKELKKTIYRPSHIILGSREKYCTNDQVKYTTDGNIRSDIDKTCKYAINNQFGYSCNVKKDDFEFLPQNDELMDIEDLIEISKKNNDCPYFYAKDVKKEVDLILVPYIYLLDRTIANSLMTSIQQGFIIFDEAHNIQKIAEEGYSYEISNYQLTTAKYTLQGLLKCDRYQENIDITNQNGQEIQQLINIIDTMIKQMDLAKLAVKEEQHDDNFQFLLAPSQKEPKSSIFDHLFTKKLKDQILKNLFIDDINIIIQFIELLELEEFKDNALGSFQHFLKGVNLIFCNLENKKQDLYYTLCLNLSETNEKYMSFKLQNLDPSLAFKNLNKKGKFNYLFTSGTLTPFESWESELKMEFPIQLDVNHDKNIEKQIFCSIVEHGPKNNKINFTHDIRKNIQSYKKMIRELGSIIIELSEIIPNGMLVIFASHGLMQNCIDRWKTDGFMIRLEVLIENKNDEKTDQIFQEFKLQANKKGAILFAVCRGRLIEGIDFTDELSRGVILAGIPNLPPCTYSNMKFQFFDHTESKLKGSEWFLQQTIRNINQAIGRVIRHKDDHGCVLMVDIRFNKYLDNFPKWIQLTDSAHFDNLLFGLKQFFSSYYDKFQEEETFEKNQQPIESMIFPELADQTLNEEQKFDQQQLQYEYMPSKQKYNVWNQQQIIQPKKNKLKVAKSFDPTQDFPSLSSEEFPSFQQQLNQGLMDEIYKQPIIEDIYESQQQFVQIKPEREDIQVIGKKKKKGKNMVYIAGGFK